MQIKQALAQLDPTNDSDWTSDGKPRMERVRELVGDDSVTRVQVEAAVPGFSRAPEPAEPEPEPAVDEDDPRQRLEKRINELIIQRDKLDAEIHALAQERDKLQELEYRQSTPAADMQRRMDYIRRQNEVRRKKAERRTELVATGIKPGEFDPRSPLDKALATRKRPPLPPRR